VGIRNTRASTRKALGIVLAAYRALSARDVESLAELVSPDVVWGGPDNPLIPSAGTRQGMAGMFECLRIGDATETIVALEPMRFLAEDDMVAVIGHTRVTATPTGNTYETDFVHLVTIADGRITRFQEFFDTYVAAEAFRR